jgi:hypothetical protein
VGSISSLKFKEREKSLYAAGILAMSAARSACVRSFISQWGVPTDTYTHFFSWGTQWRSWLRHRAASRRAAGSVPDGVIEIFHSHNPSDYTVALGSTQPVTEKSTRNTSP